MIKVEYMILMVIDDGAEGTIVNQIPGSSKNTEKLDTNKLNQLGKDGWVLCGFATIPVVPMSISKYIFMRQLPKEVDL